MKCVVDSASPSVPRCRMYPRPRATESNVDDDRVYIYPVHVKKKEKKNAYIKKKVVEKNGVPHLGMGD